MDPGLIRENGAEGLSSSESIRLIHSKRYLPWQGDAEEALSVPLRRRRLRRSVLSSSDLTHPDCQ